MIRTLLSLLCLQLAAGQLPSAKGRYNVVAKEAEPDSASIASELKKAFHTQMRSEHAYSQEVNGAIGLIFGGVLLFNGNKFFRYAIAFVIGVTIYFTTEDALAVRFHDTLPGDAPVQTTLWMKVIALELAVLVAYICGEAEDFEGIKKLVGIVLGLACFGKVQFNMLNSDQSWEIHTAENGIFCGVLGTFLIFGGFYLMAVWTSYVVALLSPAFGSVLVSGSVFFWVAYVQNPHGGNFWIDSVNALDPNHHDTGLVKGHIEGISVNRAASIGLAVLIFIISAYLQVSWARKERQELKEKSSFLKDVRDLFLCVPQKRSLSSAGW